MQFFTLSVSAIMTILPLASAHGIIISPQARVAGNAFGAACGNQAKGIAQSDPYGPIQLWQQNIPSPAPGGASCRLQVCKGLFRADSGPPQTWTVGQSVNIRVDIRAPHTGWAKVEIIDQASGTAIGSPLKSWAVYASTQTPNAPDEKNFNVVIPNLAGACRVDGACALQWYWHSPQTGNEQTYISCVDFVQA